MRNAPRIACYLPTLVGGGAEKNALTLASGLAERGYPVDLVLARKRGDYLDRIPPSLRVIELGKASRVSGVLAAARAFPLESGLVARAGAWRKHGVPQIRSLPPLARYLQREQPAVLMTHMWYCNLVGIWARALANASCCLIGVERNTLSRDVNKRLHHDRPAAFYTLMARLYARADARVTVSDGVGDDLASTTGLQRHTIQTIHNPVIDDTTSMHTADRPIHPWLQPGEPPVVLTVGRLNPQKDYPTLIKAFALLRQNRSARLIILGEGDQRHKLTEQIADAELEHDVDLPGWVDNPNAYMAHSSVFALSSRYEGLPTALIEALACGCPVVATNCPSGPDDILENGRYGALVPMADPPVLAKAIEQTLDNPGDRDARLRRAADFSVQRSIDHFERLISQILEAHETA